MNGDVMERLARANPVTELLPVEPVEQIQGLIGQHEYEKEEGPSSRVAPRRPRRLTAGFVFAAAVFAAALFALGGTSDRSVNVLSSVYAAMSPRAGIVESVTVTRTFGGPGHRSRATLREWAESSTQRRRGLTEIESLEGVPHPGQSDEVYSPSVWEAWSTKGAVAGLMPLGGRTPRPGVIYRYVWNGAYRPDSRRMGFLGSSLVGPGFTGFFRMLYSHEGWRVAGHVRRAGRLLWRIEESPAQARVRAREEHTRYFVLVDPKSFLPVYERLVTLTPSGPKTLRESELVSYQIIPSTPQNAGVFDLAAQHQGATVVTRPGPTPPKR